MKTDKDIVKTVKCQKKTMKIVDVPKYFLHQFSIEIYVLELILKLKGRSTNLPIQNLKIFSQKTGLRLVLPVTTKTGPGPQKTDKDWSWSVRSGLFGF